MSSAYDSSSKRKCDRDDTLTPPDRFMIVHRESGLVLEVLPTGYVCLSQPNGGFSQMFSSDGPYLYVCSTSDGLIGFEIENGEIVIKVINTKDFLFSKCGLDIQADGSGSIHQKNSKLCFTVKDPTPGSTIIMRDFMDRPEQIFEIVHVSNVQLDFFETRNEVLGDYPPDHPDRLEFNHNLFSNFSEMTAIFNENEKPGLSRSATDANDFYKLTMAPVVEAGEKLAGGKVVVTFAIEVRDENIAKRLLEDSCLQTKVILALDSLKMSKFRRDVVLAAVEGKPPLKQFWIQNVDRICGPRDTPDTLIRAERLDGSLSEDFHDGTVIYNRRVLPEEVEDGKVALSAYVGNDSKGALKSGCSEFEKFHIEATGRWGIVTYLETAMMQTVYSELLKDHNQKRGVSEGKWTYESLFRCYLSIKFATESCPTMKGALFSGRRTGSHLFTKLQVWYMSKFYPNCIGTSSMDAWFTLSKTLKLPAIVPPVGTHAHELSMVFMCLCPELDANDEGIAYSQACVHSLYYYLVHQGFPGPMPMLPDTLGTLAFLKAAEACDITPMVNGKLQHSAGKVSLLSVMNSARQDSGLLTAFKSALDMFPVFKGSMMASEIDTKKDLLEAAGLGYKTFGAGGFMGDSEKAWPVTETNLSASMAVKTVSVCVNRKPTPVQPVKLGDSNDTSKVTCDAALLLTDYIRIVKSAEDVKKAAIEQPHAQHTRMEVDGESFACTLISRKDSM